VKLAIGRGQKPLADRKGRSEGVIYGFACRVDLDEHEQELVQKYNQSQYPILVLGADDIRDFDPQDVEERHLRLDRLVAGWSIESRFVTDLKRTEALLKEACASFRDLLAAMESYGGQEMFEI
jgi:hypothetical protein